MNTETKYAVVANWKGEWVYLSSQTDLNWRTMLTLNWDPVPLSARSVEFIKKLAAKDDTLFGVRVEELPGPSA